VIHEHGADAATLVRGVHIKPDYLERSPAVHAWRNFHRRDHVGVTDRRAFRIFHHEHCAAVAFYRLGDDIHRVCLSKISAPIRLRMRGPVGLHEETRAERCDRLRVVARAAANGVRVYLGARHTKLDASSVLPFPM